MAEEESLTEGKWGETESTYQRAKKIYEPVLKFLRLLQKENEEDDGD